MTPPINRAKPLAFFELGPDAFQRLCRALFAELREVKNAVIYGVNGQAQRGIDLEITLSNGRRWMVQCKACGQDELKHLNAAVEDFLSHLDYWRATGAEKFIVVIGCGIEDTKVHDARRKYETQFLARGIEFELWDSSNIRHNLREMRSVVEQFLNPYFVQEICGVQPSSGFSVNAVEWQYSARPSALIADLGSSRDEKIDQLRDLIRVGEDALVEAELRTLQTTATWEVLAPETKARVFRLLGGIALDRRDDVEGAREMLAKAKAVHPDGRYVLLETSILNRTDGPAAALAATTEPLTKDEWHLRAALLINTGRNDEAIQALLVPAFEADAETFRLRALAHLQRRELPQAKQAVAEAAARAPDWTLVRQAVGLIEYFTAISDVFQGWMHWQWPLPVDWYLVRSDAESRASLLRASEIFAGLAAHEAVGSLGWQHAMGWQLAAVANDSARQAEAADLVRRILAAQPTATVAIIWGMARGYDFAREPVERALKMACARDSNDAEPVQALLSVLVSRGGFAEAATLLDSRKASYERAGRMDAWCFQRGQLWVLEGEVDKANALLADQPEGTSRDRLEAALARVTAKQEQWTPESLAVLKEAAMQDSSAEVLFEACEAHYSAGEHEYVVERADQLIRLIGTEACLRLALDSAAISKHFDKCLSLMERHRTLFRDGDFPPGIRRLRAMCLRALGRYIEAEQELRLLVSGGGETGDRYALFQHQINTGRASDASMTARSLLDDPAITAEGLLQIADKLRSDDLDLARTFLNQAVKRGVQTTQGAAFGVHVGINLGLDDQVGTWMAKAISSAGQPDAPLQPFTIAQILEMEREQNQARADLDLLYRRGQVTIHAVSNQLGQPLASFFHSHLLRSEASEAPPDQQLSLRVRHGSRRTVAKISNKEGVRLFMDVTSVMLAAHLDVLDSIEAEFGPIGVSSRLVESIQAQINALTGGQPALIPPKQHVLASVAAGEIIALENSSLPVAEECSLTQEMGQDWCARLQHVQNNDGWLVCFQPLTSNGPASTPVTVQSDKLIFPRKAGHAGVRG